MVMLTSEDDPKVRAAAEAAGIHTYLLKSGRADELLSTLRAAALAAEAILVVEPEAARRDTLPPPRIA
jgi:DNA-binding NarL/FixJ family response regulator